MRTFDLIVPLGVGCIAASQLKFRGLRIASFPFDWVTPGTRDNRLEFPLRSLETRFSEWLKPENLDWKYCAEVGKQGFHFPVYDAGSGYEFLHDFKADRFDAEDVAIVRRKYARRIDRFYEMLEKATSILFVFAGHDDELALTKLEEVYRRLKALFPDKSIMIYAFSYSAPCNSIEEDCAESDYIFVQRCSIPREEYGVSVKEWSARWLDKVKLSERIDPPQSEVSRAHAPKSFLEKLHWKCYKRCRKFLVQHNCLGSTFD